MTGMPLFRSMPTRALVLNTRSLVSKGLSLSANFTTNSSDPSESHKSSEDVKSPASTENVRSPQNQGPSSMEETKDYGFQPVAMQSYVSPMRRTITWLQAFRSRQEKKKAWYEKNKEAIAAGTMKEKGPPLESFSYGKIGAEEVLKRSPADSFSYVILPFKSDQWFLDGYINAFGRLRIGQLFQDLDALAGVIAYRHCSPAQPVLVTASVDRVYMKKRLDKIADSNVSLSGNVTWTGRSSMEITIKACTHTREMSVVDTQLSASDIKEEDVFMTANFTFVARNPITKRSFAINNVVPNTKEELLDFVRAEKYNTHKKEAAQKSGLTHLPPSEEESRIIHQKWLQTVPEFQKSHSLSSQIHTSYMADSRIHSTMMMQPQYRNRHSYMIFGGYLLRQTFELAYSCSAAFAHDVTRFVSLDETTFRNPVPVGSVLYLTATVVYTELINRKVNTDACDAAFKQNGSSNTAIPEKGTLIQVRVDTYVRDLAHGIKTDTGSFVYSFFASANSSPETSPIASGTEPAEPRYHSVLPQTYDEMMDYLEGRRRALETTNFNTYVRKIPSGEVVSE